MNKKILIYIDSLERFHFFDKFAVIKEEIVILTNILSVYFKAKVNGYNISLLHVNNNVNNEIDYKNTLDFKAGWLGRTEIEVNYNSTYTAVEKINSKCTFTYFFIWNGERTISLAISDFAKKNNIKAIYFEISNLPRKLFVDEKGVTAKSSIAKNKKILDNYDYNEDEYISWKEKYLENKFKRHHVKQARTVKSINFSYFIDLFGFLFFRLLKNENSSLLKKIKSKILANKYIFQYDKYDIFKNNYIFLPLQVSTDSQILINSDVDNIQAIQKASEMARTLNFDLLIKPHPAESNIRYLQELEQLKDKYNFYYVNLNTFELINNAKKVITINSTVGIEAMILEKEVIVLGRSYYKNFSQNDLKKYIMSYLIEIDYFSTEKINKKIIEQILKRAE